jgi:hypothetical protein
MCSRPPHRPGGHIDKGLFPAPPRLQEIRQVTPPPGLRNGQGKRPYVGLELPLLVTVPLVLPPWRSLSVARS